MRVRRMARQSQTFVFSVKHECSTAVRSPSPPHLSGFPRDFPGRFRRPRRTTNGSRAARGGFLPHRRRRMPTPRSSCGTTGDADRTHESPRRWRTISPSTKGSTLTSATTSALARRRRRGTSQVRAATSLSTSDVHDSRPTPRDRRALLSATRGMLARTVR